MYNKLKGKFIAFEGCEGTGKTTQIKLFIDFLKNHNLDTVVTREPGGCPIADKVRTILLDPQSKSIVPKAELLGYAMSRAQHTQEVILPALKADKTVICDRYKDCTVAYQGYGRGLDMKLIHKLNELATDGLTPDITLLLDMDPKLSLDRARQRQNSLNTEDRFEREALSFHTRVREGYLKIASKNPNYIIIDANNKKKNIHTSIIESIESYINSYPILKVAK